MLREEQEDVLDSTGRLMNSWSTPNLVSILKRPQTATLVSDTAVQPTESEGIVFAATRQQKGRETRFESDKTMSPTKIAKSPRKGLTDPWPTNSELNVEPKQTIFNCQDHTKSATDDSTAPVRRPNQSHSSPQKKIIVGGEATKGSPKNASAGYDGPKKTVMARVAGIDIILKMRNMAHPIKNEQQLRISHLQKKSVMTKVTEIDNAVGIRDWNNSIKNIPQPNAFRPWEKIIETGDASGLIEKMPPSCTNYRQGRVDKTGDASSPTEKISFSYTAYRQERVDKTGDASSSTKKVPPICAHFPEKKTGTRDADNPNEIPQRCALPKKKIGIGT